MGLHGWGQGRLLVGGLGLCCVAFSLMPLNSEPHDSLNNNIRFDLQETLLLTLGNHADFNPYIDNPILTTYCDTDSLSYAMNSPNNQVFASLNTKSNEQPYPFIYTD